MWSYILIAVLFAFGSYDVWGPWIASGWRRLQTGSNDTSDDVLKSELQISRYLVTGKADPEYPIIVSILVSLADKAKTESAEK